MPGALGQGDPAHFFEARSEETPSAAWTAQTAALRPMLRRPCGDRSEPYVIGWGLAAFEEWYLCHSIVLSGTPRIISIRAREKSENLRCTWQPRRCALPPDRRRFSRIGGMPRKGPGAGMLGPRQRGGYCPEGQFWSRPNSRFVCGVLMVLIPRFRLGRARWQLVELFARSAWVTGFCRKKTEGRSRPSASVRL